MKACVSREWNIAGQGDQRILFIVVWGLFVGMRRLYSPRKAENLCSNNAVSFEWRVKTGEIISRPDSLGIKKP